MKCWKSVMIKMVISLTLVLSMFVFQNHAFADASGEVDLTDGLPTSAFSASSVWNRPGDTRNFGPEKAFDNVWIENNAGFSTNTIKNEWIAVDFGKEQSISKLKYKADISYEYAYDLKDFVVQASNDNSNWETQYSGTAIGIDTIQEFVWKPTGSFRYWRVQLINNIGNNSYCIMVGEMELIGSKQEAPLDLVAVGKNKMVDLTWSPVTGATGYNVKRSTDTGGPYISIAPNVTGDSYTDNTVVNGMTYYYVVTAKDGNNESLNSNEASATPQKVTEPDPEPSGERAILTITLTTGLDKEYDLSAEELSAFLNWFDARDSGTGPAKYAINKHNNNKGPFSARKEYVIFDKILTFSVDEYSVE